MLVGICFGGVWKGERREDYGVFLVLGIHISLTSFGFVAFSATMDSQVKETIVAGYRCRYPYILLLDASGLLTS